MLIYSHILTYMLHFFNSTRKLSFKGATEALTNNRDIVFTLKFYAFWIKCSKITTINSIKIIHKIF